MVVERTRLFRYLPLAAAGFAFTIASTSAFFAGTKAGWATIDASAMFSTPMFRRFVAPALTAQCEWLDYSLYHLDGTQAVHHLADRADHEVQRGRGALADDRRRHEAALAETPPAAKTRRALIQINMDRWRWLPRDMGDERIEVNIPDFELAVIRNGAVTHRTRVIVGKEQTPTPIFSVFTTSAVRRYSSYSAAFPIQVLAF